MDRSPARRAGAQTMTGRGASPKGRRGAPANRHPDQRGGMTYDTSNATASANVRKGKHPGRKAEGSGLVKGLSRDRARAEGRTRSGGRRKNRRKARDGERQRGR